MTPGRHTEREADCKTDTATGRNENDDWEEDLATDNTAPNHRAGDQEAGGGDAALRARMPRLQRERDPSRITRSSDATPHKEAGQGDDGKKRR